MESHNLLQLVEERLSIGKERYGHGIQLNDDLTKYGVESSDWELMALEESLDGMVYCSAGIIKQLIKTPPGDDCNAEILNLLASTLKSNTSHLDTLMIPLNKENELYLLNNALHHTIQSARFMKKLQDIKKLKTPCPESPMLSQNST